MHSACLIVSLEREALHRAGKTARTNWPLRGNTRSHRRSVN